MADFIKELFEQNEFRYIAIEDNTLFVPSDGKQSEEYWLVTQCSVSQIIDEQENFYENCKKSYTQKALDKNISMLILWETNGDLPTQELKSQIMQIEENPYFFKKYVLYYSSAELEEFVRKKGDIAINELIKTKVVDRDIFDNYKRDPYILSWQSFLYRLAIKIPFVSIPIQEEVGLESLFEVNKKELSKQDMLKFNDGLLGAVSRISETNDDFSSEELFEAIGSFFEEVRDGN